MNKMGVTQHPDTAKGQPWIFKLGGLIGVSHRTDIDGFGAISFILV